MLLTEAERKIVANRAMRYPQGYGFLWATVPKESDPVLDSLLDSSKVLAAASKCKALVRRACPSYALYAFRNGSDTAALDQALADVAQTLGLSTFMFCAVLNKRPKLIARALRKGKSSIETGDYIFKALVKELH